MKGSRAGFDPVVITPEYEKPAGLCKTHKEGKSVAVDSGNVRKRAVFPKFVSVAEFDVGKVVVEIIGQSGFVYCLVAEEAVAPVAGTTVAVTEKHDAFMLGCSD